MCSESVMLNAWCSVKRVCRCGGRRLRDGPALGVVSFDKSSSSTGSDAKLSRRRERGGVGNGASGGLGVGVLQACQLHIPTL